MPSKRKFAFHLAPIKSTLGLEKTGKPEHASASKSPFANPPSPLFERPVLAPHIEADLRHTLTKVLRDINRPSASVYEEMMFRRKLAMQGSEKAATTKASQKPGHKKVSSFTVSAGDDAPSFNTTTKRYDSGIAVDGASRSSTFKDDTQQLSSIRPVMSADNSTVATEATRQVGASNGSTALTSAALTPGDVGKTNVFAQGLSKSEPSSATEVAASSEAQNWMAQEFAQTRLQHIDAPAPASSAQPPSSALPLTPAEEMNSATTDSKRRNIAAQSSTGGSSRLTASSSVPVVPVVEVKTPTPTESKKLSWWRRATISKKRSNASLKQSKSVGDTPATGERTPNLDTVVPPLPRLDTTKWPVGSMDKAAATTAVKSDDKVSSPRSPAPKTPSSVIENTIDELKRPSSAVIIDQDGEPRALSSHEERKRHSDLQDAVKLKMFSGSLKSNPSTPSGSTAEKKSFEFPRPGTGSTTHSTKPAIADPVTEVSESPSPEKTEVVATPKVVDEKPTPNPQAAFIPPPRTDSNTASITKSTMAPLLKLSTANVSTIPRTQVESPTPITPAIEELEDPYSPKPIEQIKSAEVKKTQPRVTGFMKRFGSLKVSSSSKMTAKPSKSPTIVEKETEKPSMREAKIKHYGKILETQYEKPRASRPAHSDTKLSADPKPGIRSSSPTPSDLYAL